MKVFHKNVVLQNTQEEKRASCWNTNGVDQKYFKWLQVGLMGDYKLIYCTQLTDVILVACLIKYFRQIIRQRTQDDQHNTYGRNSVCG
jgi:hypothetical protein